MRIGEVKEVKEVMKYSTGLTKAIAEWVRLNGLKDYGGATYTSLCKHFCIELNTFKSWMKKKEFKAAIEEAKAAFEQELEHDIVVSLAKAAKGYKYVKTKTEYVTDKDGKTRDARKTTEEIDVQPNVGAAVFILTNIAPERWQNKQNQFAEIQGDLSLSVKVVGAGTPKIPSGEDEVDERQGDGD